MDDYDVEKTHSFVKEQAFLLFEAGDIAYSDLVCVDACIGPITRKYLHDCDAWEAENETDIPLSAEISCIHSAISAVIHACKEPDKTPIMEQYSIHIRRNDTYLTFYSLNDLQDEIKRHFTKKEQSSGIVDRLSSPMMKNESPGYWSGSSSFRDFEVQCEVFYPEFFIDTDRADITNVKRPLGVLLDKRDMEKRSLEMQISDAKEKHFNAASKASGRTEDLSR